MQQRRLARILRGLREGAGLTIDQVAEKLERPERVERYRLIFSHLQAAALNPVESVRALADVQQHLLEPERG